MTFADVLDRWLSDASPTNLEAVRDAVQTDPRYSSGTELASRVVPLLERGAHAQARDVLIGAMPGAFLSPMAHSLLARAHLALGDERQALQERSLARAAMVSILTSGDGSRDRPWVVLRISDEYDVMGAMGLSVGAQRVEQPPGRVLDEIIDTDDGHWWFELRHEGRRRKEAA